MHTSRTPNLVLARNFGLLTAEILYGMPDYPDILQTFILQDYDVAPEFPRFIKFMDFWVREIDGPIHSVTVAHAALIKPRELVMVDGKILLN
ncbi:MAG: hypothetical protein V4436_03130 [Patescibacteria group bacterium]